MLDRGKPFPAFLFYRNLRGDIVKEEIIIAAGSLLSLAATYCITVGSFYIRKKISELKKTMEIEDKEIISIGLDTAEKTIEIVSRNVVGKLEQVSGEELREKVKQGLADKEELIALADEAYEEIKSSISPELIETLKSGVSDVESYIRNEIERQVGIVKKTGVAR